MAESKGAEAAPSKKKVDLWTIIVAVFSLLNLSGVLGGAFLVYKSTLGWTAPSITERKLASAESDEAAQFEDQNTLIYTMDKITVNMGGEPQRTIQMEINLEMLNKDGFEELLLPDNQAKVKDGIISILNSRNFSDVESIQGKLFLKDQVAAVVNSIMDRGVVKEVYFTEFVAQ